jgi:tetratricopeptide (TPR) repeat protein
MHKPYLHYLLSFSLLALLHTPCQAVSISYQQGVESYKQGHYVEAEAVFATLAKAANAQPETLYYWAISLAQLGRYEEARRAYHRALSAAESGSEVATLSQEGLANIPSSLDKPPGGKAPATGMDSQAMQSMMMMNAMAGSGGGGNNGGMNWMMLPMMQQQQQPGQANPMFSPEMMKSMMMSQMMNNLDFSNKKDE